MRLLLQDKKNILILIFLLVIPTLGYAESRSLWGSFELGTGIMKESEIREHIKGKDLLKGKLYLELADRQHLWNLGFGYSQFKMLDTFSYKNSQSFESDSFYVSLANRYRYENNWAVGAAAEYYLNEGLVTGNNSREKILAGLDLSYDFFSKMRMNLSLMQGFNGGSHYVLFALLGVHLKIN